MSHDAINRDARIRYQVAGDGEPLVLGHGFSDGLETWAETGWLPALRARFQVILVDLRGHGRSSRPRSPDAYAVAPRARDIVAVLDALAIERAHYLGVSLGGWTGLCVAATAPARLRSLAVGSVPIFGQSMEPVRRAMAAGLDAWLRLLEQSVGPVAGPTRARLLANDRVALAAAVARDRPAMHGRLARLDAPALFFCGGRDPLYAEVRRSAGVLPGARFVELAGVDHVQACLRPLVLPAYLDFVNQATRRATPPG